VPNNNRHSKIVVGFSTMCLAVTGKLLKIRASKCNVALMAVVAQVVSLVAVMALHVQMVLVVAHALVVLVVAVAAVVAVVTPVAGNTFNILYNILPRSLKSVVFFLRVIGMVFD
jgi:hypothetical protein